MMFQWKPNMIRFMRSAIEYGDYNEQLSRTMQPYLTGEEHICDVGCGLGGLSLALAPRVRWVTAVDVNADALAVLAESRSAQGLDNLDIRCGDIFKTPPETPYDAMVFCFFGHISEILQVAKEQCRGRVFVFGRNYKNHRFSSGPYETGEDSRLRSREDLRQLGIPFEEQDLALEFGQPFTDWEDARCFFATYQRDEVVVEDAYLETHLVHTGRSDFPLYLPHKRGVAFLTFDAADIPETVPHLEAGGGACSQQRAIMP